jgi:outer membrane lipoprotein-sorting protein
VARAPGLRLRRFTCVVGALFFAGCATVRPPLLHAPPATLPAAADLEASLRQRREAVSSLRALARLRYHDPHESSSSRQAIVVQRPDHVRVEVLSLLGAVFLLTADGDTLTAYVPGERTVYRGPATPENLWRYTRLWLPVEELVDIVLGTPSVPVDPRGRVGFDSATGWIRLQHDTGHGTQAIWFGDGQLPVAAERRDAEGTLTWQTRYAGYAERDGLAVATHVDLELPRWSRTMELDFEDVDVNPAVDRALFALQPPPGSKLVNLDSVVN